MARTFDLHEPQYNTSNIQRFVEIWDGQTNIQFHEFVDYYLTKDLTADEKQLMNTAYLDIETMRIEKKVSTQPQWP